ncbi:hypothetical protein [Helicobacter kayseriensis]|uniref:hypothetical protein n=1 Tax=Helicobacter kayseriensis TaxID=2905877 RepID=UPI001E48DABD|nr:hypothetical protein [Helicobacter kayseriensis]MCE3046769.1 hypothetical protein [Helicobacter kayseriensis]MCE3047929.1 hypothetical protein [Helicobacter kayseriensis]
MRFIVFLLLVSFSLLFGNWVMFADSKDTYLYNTQTGEIYIRYRKKGKNYEDVFVKMPRGMTPQEIKNPAHLDPKSDESLTDAKLKSLKKSQEMMNEALKEF